jgi:hypothetical protein
MKICFLTHGALTIYFSLAGTQSSFLLATVVSNSYKKVETLGSDGARRRRIFFEKKNIPAVF